MRVLLKVLLVCAVVGGLAPSARANDVFQVDGVYVDVTADSVSVAKTKARQQAEERAFTILLRRLTMKVDYDYLPWLEPDVRAQYVQSFSVSGEKTSSVRYLATYSYRFKADDVRSLLKMRNISFAETMSKPILILPLLEKGGRISIWGEGNVWRDAWSTVPTNQGLVPLALPLGDVTDISSLSETQIFQNDGDAIMGMAQRYGSPNAMTAQISVRQTNPKDEIQSVDLILTRFGAAQPTRNTMLGLAREVDETQQAFLKRVALLVRDQVEESWKEQNLLQFGISGVLPVNLRISGLAEWLDVQKRLQGVPVVRKIELALLSRDAVQLNLHYIGDLNQLITSIQQVDLDLGVEGENWALMNKRGRF